LIGHDRNPDLGRPLSCHRWADLVSHHHDSGVIPLPEPIKTVINVIMIVVLVLIVIYALMPLLHVGVGHLR
jgi:hypothetical protein